MNDIKFRVWDIPNKRMIYFNAFDRWGMIDHTKDTTHISTGHNQILISNDPKEFIWMQFTGQKDKGKREIYEGDVVKFYDGSGRYEIIFQHGAFLRKSYKNNYVLGLIGSETDLIVIGNIYENPELSKQ